MFFNPYVSRNVHLTFDRIVFDSLFNFHLNNSDFKRQVFRGKLAIAITANFVNKNSPEDNAVEEIGGLFYVFNQPFFDGLRDRGGIVLENLVYFKDDTHYFVMTARKHSLLAKGVLREVGMFKIRYVYQWGIQGGGALGA